MRGVYYFLVWVVVAVVAFSAGRSSAAECGGDCGATPYASGGSAVPFPRDFRFTLPLFSAGSPWTQTATGAAVLPESETRLLTTYRVMRGNMGDHVGEGVTAFNWPFLILNYDEWAVTVFRAGSGSHDVLICDYGGQRNWPSPTFPGDYNEPGGPVTIPDSVGQVIAAGPANRGADGWTVLYDPATNRSYDFWQATTQRDGECQSRGAGVAGDAIVEAGAIELFDMGGAGVNPDRLSSAHAMGTPLLAGLLLPEDIVSGEIAHALAYAIPDPRNIGANPSEPDASDYVYPASTTETDYYSSNPDAMIAGQRLRLKGTLVNGEGAVIDESRYAPITRMLLTALRTYGAYLIDNASGFSFYAEDIHTATLDLGEDEINALIGKPAGTPLPTGKTGWRILMEKIAEDMDTEGIPLGYGPWEDGQDPSSATVEVYNFEIVAPPARP